MAVKVWSPGDVLTAADLNKFGEGMWNSYSGTCDSAAQLIVTHGAGFTPSVVLVTPSSPASTNFAYPIVIAKGATTFTIQYVDTTGTVRSTAVTGYFLCLP